MRITTVLTLVCALNMFAENTLSQNARVTIHKSNVLLEEIFNEIESQTDYLFVYNAKVNTDRQVTVDANNKPVSKVLTELLNHTGIIYSMEGSHIILSRREEAKPLNTPVRQQSIQTISGVVLDEEGEPVIGANIVEKGTTNGTISDLDGKFVLEVPGNATLQVSYVGYIPQDVIVNNQTVLNIRLVEDAQGLEEIVVVGYGVMKKRDLTGSVASVDSKKLATMPTGNPLEALQGKIAGVDIGATTEPGGSPTITVRGNRSINASNTPLYVVDGIPRNTISDIAVADIESIEVLKDAASTAIYGSRGANGVILVSTKRAKENQPTQVSFSAYVGMNDPAMHKMASGEEYIQLRRDAARMNQTGGWSNGYPDDDTIFFDNEKKTISKGNYVDWQDLLFRSGINQEYNLSVSHGSDKTQMLVNVGYRFEEGYYQTSDNRRYSLGINLDHKISNFIKIGISSKLTHTTNNYPNRLGGIALAYMNPLAQPFEEDGVTMRRIPSDLQATYNIIANYYEPYRNANIALRSFNVAYVELSLLKNLKLRSNLGLDIVSIDEDEFYGQYSFNGGGQNNYGKKGAESNLNLTWDNILTYIEQFDKHSINVSAVTSLQNETKKSSFSSGQDIPVEDLENWNLGTATSNLTIGSDYQKWAMSSFLARIQYGYDNRYLFNVAFRADGSSVLAPGNKWGFFPSASAAWVASEEKFFNSSLISNLKLRLSYGVVGNSAISPYQTIPSLDQSDYNFGNTYYYGYKLGAVVNKDLGWEYSKTFNVGIDMGLWKNRLSIYADFYHTYTSDLLMQRLIPTFNGSEYVWQNIGATSNTGLELAMNSINIDRKNFVWRTDLNFYTNKEKIEKLITGDDMVGNSWFIGKPINVFYDFEKIGIWQLGEEELAASYKRTPGEIKIKDQNDDGVVDADNDKIILGQQNPKWTLFLRNSFDYKGFNFAFALEGKFGHKVLSPMLGRTVYLDGTRQIPKAVHGNYWTPENPTNKYPNVGEAVPLDIDIIGIRKASYLNVQEISLGYNFTNIPFLKNLYLYARVKNPFFIWTADGDLNPMSPTYEVSAYKTYVLGINVNF